MTVDPSINGVASSCNPAPPAPKLACFWSKSCPRAAHSGEEGFSAQLAETTVKDAKVTTARNMMLKREWAIRRELKVLWKAWELWGIFLAKFHAMQDMSNYEMPNSWHLFTRSFNLSKCHALNPSKTKNCINDKKRKKKTLCRFAIFFFEDSFQFLIFSQNAQHPVAKQPASQVTCLPCHCHIEIQVQHLGRDMACVEPIFSGPTTEKMVM